MTSVWPRSSIGKKALMAISGLVLLGFVIAHLLGNLLIYAGPEAINAYAQKLRQLGLLLWGARLVLLTAVIVHLVASIQVALENRAARPQPYRVTQTTQTTLGARTMMVSGILLVAFIVYHLLHFTFGTAHPEFSQGIDAFGRHDVYAMTVMSFNNPYISFAYVVGVAILCFHLGHGIESTCQSLGLNNARTIGTMTYVGQLLALALFIGYVSIPLSILLGFVTLG